MTSPEIALAQLWRWAGCDPFALERVRFHGGDPVLATHRAAESLKLGSEIRADEAGAANQ